MNTKAINTIKRKFKNVVLSKIRPTKGYIVDGITETENSVNCDFEYSGNSLCVLVNKWNFSNEDHCYVYEVEDEDLDMYEDDDVCPLCDVDMKILTEVRSQSGQLGIQTGVCECCGFIKHTRNLNSTWYSNHFRDKWLKSDSQREANVALKDQPYDSVITYLEAGAKVADVGCGIGDRLKKFKDNGFEIHGCEPSKHRSEIASNFLGSAIYNGGGEEFLESRDEKFDLIYFFTVLSFTKNPFYLLKKASELLNDGGYLHVVDSQFDYHNIFHASHLGVARSFMSVSSVLKFCDLVGLSVVKFEPEPFEFLFVKSTKAAKKVKREIKLDRYITSELYPKLKSDNWLELSYQPFGRKIQFSIMNNAARDNFVNGKINYPIKFVSCGMKNAPVMLK